MDQTELHMFCLFVCFLDDGIQEHLKAPGNLFFFFFNHTTLEVLHDKNKIITVNVPEVNTSVNKYMISVHFRKVAVIHRSDSM